MGKVLTLGAVFQLFRMVHLNLSCVAELCKLLDILQDHFFKSNVGRSVRLELFLLPSHSSCQPWVTALVKVVVATPLVLVGDVVENRLPLFPKDICIAITCCRAPPEMIRYRPYSGKEVFTAFDFCFFGKLFYNPLR